MESGDGTHKRPHCRRPIHSKASSSPILKPSSPLFLPHESYDEYEQSDEFSEGSESELENFTPNASKTSPEISRSHSSFDSNHSEQEYTHYTRQTTTKTYQKFTTQKLPPAVKSKPYWQYWRLIALVMMGLLVFGSSKWYEPKPPISCPKFKEFSKSFSQEKILWQSLTTGVESVLNNKPPTPSIFLLAYNDHRTSEVLMKNIINATAECMKSNNPILLDGRTFVSKKMLEDYGEIIETYREQLESNGIMYVSDLNKTPAQAAQAFHSICDTVTPLVQRAVIYFTVQVDQSDLNLPPVQLLKLVEDKLSDEWRREATVSENTLKALITRVTDQVLLLRADPKI